MKTAMARHILVKTKREADDLLQQLAKKADFAKLARKHSTCNSAKRGGDLGEVRQGEMVPAINNVIFKKPVNKFHGPIKTKFGFHIVEVYFRD